MSSPSVAHARCPSLASLRGGRLARRLSRRASATACQRPADDGECTAVQLRERAVRGLGAALLSCVVLLSPGSASAGLTDLIAAYSDKDPVRPFTLYGYTTCADLSTSAWTNCGLNLDSWQPAPADARRASVRTQEEARHRGARRGESDLQKEGRDGEELVRPTGEPDRIPQGEHRVYHNDAMRPSPPASSPLSVQAVITGEAFRSVAEQVRQAMLSPPPRRFT